MKPDKVEAYLAKLKHEHERDALIGERAAHWQRWIDKAIEDVIDGGGDVDVEPADLLAELLAAQHDVFDQESAQRDAEHRAETGALRRRLVTAEIAHTAERRRRVEEASALRRRITTLETRLSSEREARDAMRKEIAALAKELARDRAHRRLLDSRRTYAHASRVELEKARRRTDQLIEDRALEGGSFDA